MSKNTATETKGGTNMKTHLKDEKGVDGLTGGKKFLTLCGSWVDAQDPLLPSVFVSCQKCKNEQKRREAEVQRLVKEKREEERSKKQNAHLQAMFKEDAYKLDENLRRDSSLPKCVQDFGGLLYNEKSEMEYTLQSLKQKAEQIRDSMNRLLKEIEEDGCLARFNSNGELQGSGGELDRLVVQFSQHQKAFRSLAMFAARAQNIDGFQTEKE